MPDTRHSKCVYWALSTLPRSAAMVTLRKGYPPSGRHLTDSVEIPDTAGVKIEIFGTFVVGHCAFSMGLVWSGASRSPAGRLTRQVVKRRLISVSLKMDRRLASLHLLPVRRCLFATESAVTTYKFICCHSGRIGGFANIAQVFQHAAGVGEGRMLGDDLVRETSWRYPRPGPPFPTDEQDAIELDAETQLPAGFA